MKDELLRAIIENDILIRNMRHRDAQWHDDPEVQRVLVANSTIIRERNRTPTPVRPEELVAADYEAALADHRRLARELDVALHGEEGAASQASLCDLVGPAKALRAENERLKMALAIVDGTSQCSRWKTNQHVNTLDDFRWWVDVKLREYALMAANSQDPELTDWVAARLGTFEEVKLNLTRAHSSLPAEGR